jgi:putative hydrolase of the HAD superfamily
LKIYKHIFFDLDHTLWDYDRNAAEALAELFAEAAVEIKHPQIGFDAFVKAYHLANLQVWDQYNRHQITKQELRNIRFNMVLAAFGVKDSELARFFEEGFFLKCPAKPHTFPFAHEALGYLAKRCQLHIITNGFDETQSKKMESSNIATYFQQVVTSESMGYRKPDSRIFAYALEAAGAESFDSLMVGDNPDTDVAGARNAGIDQVLFDPENRYEGVECTYRINCLSKLKEILTHSERLE